MTVQTTSFWQSQWYASASGRVWFPGIMAPARPPRTPCLGLLSVSVSRGLELSPKKCCKKTILLINSIEQTHPRDKDYNTQQVAMSFSKGLKRVTLFRSFQTFIPGVKFCFKCFKGPSGLCKHNRCLTRSDTWDIWPLPSLPMPTWALPVTSACLPAAPQNRLAHNSYVIYNKNERWVSHTVQ